MLKLRFDWYIKLNPDFSNALNFRTRTKGRFPSVSWTDYPFISNFSKYRYSFIRIYLKGSKNRKSTASNIDNANDAFASVFFVSFFTTAILSTKGDGGHLNTTVKLNSANINYNTCVLTLRNEKHQQNHRSRYRKHGASSRNFVTPGIEAKAGTFRFSVSNGKWNSLEFDLNSSCCLISVFLFISYHVT